ncbi:hypothetical protein POK33_12720 [Burkholderia cenocepacia]|uniref:hypothetical protein n=1 Tax=Burkholderia cenocepacia TaxID=95486 RepID=UPI0023B9B49D|nr:hypothetical protein [Burkholderia cenocepacia]MDF0501581.1 hypothetical protein [Burkholderia cenocepacia]
MTTENSRADALTPEEIQDRLHRFNSKRNTTAMTVVSVTEFVIELLAASSVSQPAAAPTDDEQRIEAMARAMNVDTDGHDRYWTGYVPSAGAALRALRDMDKAATSANETGAEGAAGLAHELWAAAQLAPGEGIEDGVRRIEAIVSRSPATAAAPPALPIELNSVAETLAEGNGFWRSCSGCHETNEGHETGHYPYSKILKCHLGGGCSECGGIGAVWDDTDYEAMGRDFERSLVAPSNSPAMAAEAPADERAACQAALRKRVDAGIRTDITNFMDGWQARAAASPAAEESPDELPHWFEMFLTNVCEIPDRNSPEDEPDAVVATLDELRNCALNAIEQCVSYAAPVPAMAAEAVAYVCSASNDFAPIVRDKGAAQRLSNAHGDGKIVPLYAGAQADARKALKDALRRAREELSIIEWENDPPARVTNLFSTIDALLGAHPGHPEPHETKTDLLRASEPRA